MRKTLDEILAMGREGFLDAMMAELEGRLARPGLSADEHKQLREEIEEARGQLAARRQRQSAAAARAA